MGLILCLFSYITVVEPIKYLPLGSWPDNGYRSEFLLVSSWKVVGYSHVALALILLLLKYVKPREKERKKSAYFKLVSSNNSF